MLHLFENLLLLKRQSYFAFLSFLHLSNQQV
nr:MAG TPA: hypothetical protein [Caudoviricetes sp.]